MSSLLNFVNRCHVLRGFASNTVLTFVFSSQSATSKRALASAESSGNRKIEMLQKDLDRATAAAATREDELNRKLDAALRDARRLKQQVRAWMIFICSPFSRTTS